MIERKKTILQNVRQSTSTRRMRALRTISVRERVRKTVRFTTKDRLGRERYINIVFIHIVISIQQNRGGGRAFFAFFPSPRSAAVAPPPRLSLYTIKSPPSPLPESSSRGSYANTNIYIYNIIHNTYSFNRVYRLGYRRRETDLRRNIRFHLEPTRSRIMLL